MDHPPFDASTIDLQPLFDAPILQQERIADVHPGQASWVWRVTTQDGLSIVRTTRRHNAPADPFWDGCRLLFGVDPLDVHASALINDALAPCATVPVPRVRQTAHLGNRPFLVVEHLPGQTVRSFNDLPVTSAWQLGQAIASIHGCRAVSDAGTQASGNACGHVSNALATFGNFRGTFRQPFNTFPAQMATAMAHLVNTFYMDGSSGSAEVRRQAPAWIDRARRMPPPNEAVPILLDMDPTQFLADADGHLTGLVDTELYALGPSAYDLVALELLLDAPHAAAFRDGYVSMRHWPDLRSVRPVYRFLQLLMELQGRVEPAAWMTHPPTFDSSPSIDRF